MKMKKISFAVLLPLLSLSSSAVDNIYVSTNGIHAVAGSDLGWGTYTTDDGVDHDAYTNLQQAVSSAAKGDTVWVENGFVCDASAGYTEASNKWCNSRLRIGTGVTVRSRSGTWQSGCVIEGSAVEPKVGGVHFVQNDHTARLIGFEIRNCERSNTSYAGKAVYHGSISNCLVHTCLQSGSTLENVWAHDSVVSNCWSTGTQGIAYNGAFYDCLFIDVGKGLSSRVDGGQLVLQSRSSSNVGIVSNCTFRNCYGSPWLVTSKQAYNADEAPVLMDCVFEGCTGSAVVGTEYGSDCYINLTNCVFRGNAAACISFSYVQGSRTGDFATCWNCVFTNNYAATILGPGAFYNCLVAGNDSSDTLISNPDTTKILALYNCTVVDNTVSGGSAAAGGNLSVINTILRDNAIAAGAADSFVAATNSCIEEVAAVAYGQGNIVESPRLIDIQAGFYQPGDFSPCISAGSTTAYRLTASDLAGLPRVSDGKVSIGAFEYDPDVVYLAGCVKYPEYLYAPAAVTFEPAFSGCGSSPLFCWDFDGDGVFDEVTTQSVLTHAFGLGDWNVTLCVSNRSADTSVSFSYGGFTVTERPVRYVKAGNENAAPPYGTESTAASDIQTAIDFSVDGDEIVILPGIYSNDSPVVVNKDLIVHGSTGNPEDVKIHQTANERCLVIRGAANTIVHSLVLENGGKNERECQGAGVLIAADDVGVDPAYGILSNAVVRNCRVTYQLAGTPGVAAIGPNAFVTHCVISNCVSYSGFNNTGRLCALALFLKKGGRAENCLIAKNSTDLRKPYGIPWDGDVWTDGKMNYAYQGLYHVTVHIGDGSSMRFCTIVTNTASFCGGVNVAGSGRFSECVIAGNKVQLKYLREISPRYQVWSVFAEPTGDWHLEWEGGQAKFDGWVAEESGRALSAAFYSAQTTNACNVSGNGLGAGTVVAPTEKLVRNAARDRYGLPPHSPAIDKVPSCSVSGMAAGDLAGNARLFGEAYDLGAFEKVQRGLTVIVK